MTNSTLGETIPILAIDAGVLKIVTRLAWEIFCESNYLRGHFPLLPLPFLTNYAFLMEAVYHAKLV